MSFFLPRLVYGRCRNEALLISFIAVPLLSSLQLPHRFVHDLRQSLHKSLRERNAEYQEKQKQVLEQTRNIQREKASADDKDDGLDMSDATYRSRLFTE